MEQFRAFSHQFARYLLAPFPWLLLVVIALGWHAGALATSMLSLRVASPPIVWQPAPVPERAAQPDTRADRLAIALFGEPQAEESGPVPVDLPETGLDFVLLGVYSVGEQQGVAYIQVRGETDPYRPGDALPGEATVTAIYPDRIVLERDGAAEMLLMAHKDPEQQRILLPVATDPEALDFP